MKKIIVLIGLISAVYACQKPQTAEDIVNDAILEAGGQAFDASEIEFIFRDKYYKAKRNAGNYQLERVTIDSVGELRDVLTNTGFTRYLDGEPQFLSDSLVERYSSAVNSVHYFSVLPYGLNAPAVNKTYLGEVVLKNQPYHKIKITFDEDGGGEDFEDVFVYWIHKTRKTTDYLAYSYQVNGGGVRFRVAKNSRRLGGIRFSDYTNYKPKLKGANVIATDSLFEAGELEQLSEINLESVNVKNL